MKKQSLLWFVALIVPSVWAVQPDYPSKFKDKALVDSIRLIVQDGGKTLGYSTKSGIKILTVDGFAFKDLNRNEKLDKYEDWRLPYEERAKDLVHQLSIEEIAGLMLYSSHQSIPAVSGGMGASTYNGKSFEESGAHSYDLTDAQKNFLYKDNVRHGTHQVRQELML